MTQANNPAVSDEPGTDSHQEIDSFPPEYSFIGTDGQIYTIGPTSREFEDYVANFSLSGINTALTADELDKWIWMHLKTQATQRNMKLEQVKTLYFVIDRPLIMNMIVNRFKDGQKCTLQAMQGIAEGLKEVQQIINENRHEGRVPEEP
jgi:hypothetical protein